MNDLVYTSFHTYAYKFLRTGFGGHNANVYVIWVNIPKFSSKSVMAFGVLISNGQMVFPQSIFYKVCFGVLDLCKYEN